MYKKYIYALTILAIVTIAFITNSCQDGSIALPNTDAESFCGIPNVFCGSPGTVKIQNPCPGDVTTIDLWAGVGNNNGGTLVGKVELYQVSGSDWKVKYIFTDPLFVPSVIHFAIAATKNGIPHNNSGNPIPGKFPYSFDGPFTDGMKEFNIDLSTISPPVTDSGYFMAAHAGGVLYTQQGLYGNLTAECVTASNIHHQLELGSFYNFNLSNAGTLSGTINGWCVDLAHTHQENHTFGCAKLYSSLSPESLPPEDIGFPYIDHPENFDKINYLLNHFKVGQPLPPLATVCTTAAGNITVLDIQAVVWYYLDETPNNIEDWVNGPLAGYQGLYDINRIKAIICDVNALGDNFIPSCSNGDLISIIVIPDGENIPFTTQPMIFSVPCSGGTEETAWGDGKYGANFTSSSWATYFRWYPTCP